MSIENIELMGTANSNKIRVIFTVSSGEIARMDGPLLWHYSFLGQDQDISEFGPLFSRKIINDGNNMTTRRLHALTLFYKYLSHLRRLLLQGFRIKLPLEMPLCWTISSLLQGNFLYDNPSSIALIPTGKHEMFLNSSSSQSVVNP